MRIDADIAQLHAAYLQAGGAAKHKPLCRVADVAEMAKTIGIAHGPTGRHIHGLQALAGMAGVPPWKRKSLTISNWAQFPLSTNQIRYAAIDAWAGLHVYRFLTTAVPQEEQHEAGTAVHAGRSSRSADGTDTWAVEPSKMGTTGAGTAIRPHTPLDSVDGSSSSSSSNARYAARRRMYGYLTAPEQEQEQGQGQKGEHEMAKVTREGSGRGFARYQR